MTKSQDTWEGLENRLITAIASAFEGEGQAWTTDNSGDHLAAIAGQAAMRALTDRERVDAIAEGVVDLRQRDINVPAQGRYDELKQSKHVRAQVKRVMFALKIIQGRREVADFNTVLHNVATQIALLEVNPQVESCANSGGVQVERSRTHDSHNNYHIMLWSSTVHGFQVWAEESFNQQDQEED